MEWGGEKKPRQIEEVEALEKGRHRSKDAIKTSGLVTMIDRLLIADTEH